MFHEIGLVRLRWDRAGFRTSGRWRPRRRGGPQTPADIRQLILEMSVSIRRCGFTMNCSSSDSMSGRPQWQR